MSSSSEEVNVIFKKFLPSAVIPTKATEGSHCYDIYFIEDDYVLAPGEKKNFRTGLGMQAKIGDAKCAILIRQRSGHRFKDKTLNVFQGTIDYDYVDEIMVNVINEGAEPVKLSTGDRFAQFHFDVIRKANFVEADELIRGERNGGFGSSGR